MSFDFDMDLCIREDLTIYLTASSVQRPHSVIQQDLFAYDRYKGGGRISPNVVLSLRDNWNGPCTFTTMFPKAKNIQLIEEVAN